MHKYTHTNSPSALDTATNTHSAFFLFSLSTATTSSSLLICATSNLYHCCIPCKLYTSYYRNEEILHYTNLLHILHFHICCNFRDTLFLHNMNTTLYSTHSFFTPHFFIISFNFSFYF